MTTFVEDAIIQLESVIGEAHDIARATDSMVESALKDTALYDAAERRSILDAWRDRHPYPGYDEHLLDHILTDLRSQPDVWNGQEIDLRQHLLDHGYDDPTGVDQVLTRWRIMPKTPLSDPDAEDALFMDTCSTCGGVATHRYATMGLDGRIHSMAGPGVFSPTCDACDDPTIEEPQTGQFRITAPLRAIGIEQETRSEHQLLADLWRTDPTALAGAILTATDAEIEAPRHPLALAMASYAGRVQGITGHGDGDRVSFGEVLCDLLVDAATLGTGRE